MIEAPFISVIIPTLNRAKLLKHTLESISWQTWDRLDLVEIIVVDNGSTDDTKNICMEAGKALKNFSYHYDDEPGLLSGRHRGIMVSSGEILCFLDDDVVINENYFQNLFELFKSQTNCHLATGPNYPTYEVEPPDWVNFLWQETHEGKFCTWLSLLDFGNEAKPIHPNFVWGLNFCIRKKTVLEFDGFNPDCIPKHLQKFQGDGETGLTNKAFEKKYLALYTPGLALHHYISKHRLDLEYFKKRAFYQGVCNSYATLRNGKQNPSKKNTSKDKARSFYRAFKNVLANKKQNPTNMFDEIVIRLIKEEEKGFKFHQKHFFKDANVRNWVVKKNYWDYKLPTEGLS